MLCVMKKAVLLHPLSERKRGRREGNTGARKFFESLRPAQKHQRRCEAARGIRDPRLRLRASIEAEPEIQNKTRKTIVQRRV